MNFCASLIAFLSILLTEIAFSSALGDLAAAMKPGEWKLLSTQGLNGGLVFEPCGDGSNILEYADGGAWDPVSNSFHFLGVTHGSCMGWGHVSYTAATNQWRQEPMIPGYNNGDWGHAYHHNTINPANGDFYHRPYGSKTVYKFSTNGAKSWIALPQVPFSGSAACCAALEYFPEMKGLVFVEGTYGVWFYSDSANAWRQLANTALTLNGSLPKLTMGGYDNVTEYNPVHKVLLFGGGRNGGNKIFKMDGAGKITPLKDAPGSLFPGSVYGLLGVDPVSGDYLVFKTDKTFLVYDIVNDAWDMNPRPFSFSLFYGSSFEMTESDVPPYGVNLFVTHKPAEVWVYKHAAGSTTAAAVPAMGFAGSGLEIWPNPVHAGGVVEFKSRGLERISVLDVRGKPLIQLAVRKTADNAAWRPQRLASGIYLVRGSAEGRSSIQKRLVVVR